MVQKHRTIQKRYDPFNAELYLFVQASQNFLYFILQVQSESEVSALWSSGQGSRPVPDGILCVAIAITKEKVEWQVSLEGSKQKIYFMVRGESPVETLSVSQNRKRTRRRQSQENTNRKMGYRQLHSDKERWIEFQSNTFPNPFCPYTQAIQPSRVKWGAVNISKTAETCRWRELRRGGRGNDGGNRILDCKQKFKLKTIFRRRKRHTFTSDSKAAPKKSCPLAEIHRGERNGNAVLHLDIVVEELSTHGFNKG